MNKQNFTNNGKKVIFALLVLSTLGLTSAPAKADDAVIQETVQESYTTGSGNVSVQHSNQQNRQTTEYQGRDGYQYNNTGNTGIVQRSQQYCDQYGELNTCVQDTEQRNANHQRRVRY